MLGSGPNRIGQGIEFDYCCVHAAQALRRLGYEAVLVNSNPETVSTDYDTSDRLYLEPLTLERVLDVCELEQPLGVVVSLGGQTPLRLAPGLAEAGVPLLGDPLDAIDRAEDRGAFAALLAEHGIAAPAWGVAADARRHSRWRSGSATRCWCARTTCWAAAACASCARPDELMLDEPCLVDRFLEGAIELDVDALCDGEGAWVAAILEHVEPAGVHSGDSACVVPAPSVTPALEAEIRRITATIAQALGARGLLNLQLAVVDGRAVGPGGEPARVADGAVRREGDRPAARRPRVPAAARRAAGRLGLPERAVPTRAWAKEAVFPAERFPGADERRPEMRSTGEVMASADDVSQAYARALRAAGRMRRGGAVAAPLQAIG